MNEFLIDTNIYSHAMRAEPAVVSLLRRASRIVLSSISIGELLSGFKGGTQERKNREELAEFLDTRRVSICGVSEDTAEFYAEILNGLRNAGTPIPTNDIWIAAQAMEHGLRLVLDGSPFRIRGGVASGFTRAVHAARGERRTGRTTGELIYSRNKSGRKRLHAEANYVPTLRPHHAQIR